MKHTCNWSPGRDDKIGKKKIFEGIMAEIFPSLVENINLDT